MITESIIWPAWARSANAADWLSRRLYTTQSVYETVLFHKSFSSNLIKFSKSACIESILHDPSPPNRHETTIKTTRNEPKLPRNCSFSWKLRPTHGYPNHSPTPTRKAQTTQNQIHTHRPRTFNEICLVSHNCIKCNTDRIICIFMMIFVMFF